MGGSCDSSKMCWLVMAVPKVTKKEIQQALDMLAALQFTATKLQRGRWDVYDPKGKLVYPVASPEELFAYSCGLNMGFRLTLPKVARN